MKVNNRMQSKHFRHYVMDRWTDGKYHVFIRYYGKYNDKRRRCYAFKTNWAALKPFARYNHEEVTVNNQRLTEQYSVKQQDNTIIVHIDQSIPFETEVTIHFVFDIVHRAPAGTKLSNQAALQIFNPRNHAVFDVYSNLASITKPIKQAN